MASEPIYLQIENKPVICEKQKLMENSEYFRAMFEGNFIERRKKVIELKDVDLKAMNIILILISNELFCIETEDLLVVLQTACMLQFQKIKDKCIKQITEELCPTNCLPIWHVTEKLQIKPLFLHAKAMALEQFEIVKDTSYILDLTLEEIYNYLGHKYLKTDSEFSVIQTVMKWWNANNGRYVENTFKVSLKLLSCVCWLRVLDQNFTELMSYDIASNSKIMCILMCVMLLKNQKCSRYFSVECNDIAKLLLNTQRRTSPVVPCILANCVQSKDKIEKNQEQEHSVIYYDNNFRKFKWYCDFDGNKTVALDGFSLMSCNKHVFLYGGEYRLGRGKWNSTVWEYDVIRERWKTKCMLPFKRRHFETCTVGDDLIVAGGTGQYRVKQNNMFFYNIPLSDWSRLIPLPSLNEQFKCCDFKNKLLVLNMNEKLGFFYDKESDNWKKVIISIDWFLLTNLCDYSIFSYNNLLYVKGKHLIAFKFEGNMLQCMFYKRGIGAVCDKLELALCDNVVYTLYKYRHEDHTRYTLETYDLDNNHIDYIFKDKLSEDMINVDGNLYTVSSSLKIFSIQHHSLVEDNMLINHWFS